MLQAEFNPKVQSQGCHGGNHSLVLVADSLRISLGVNCSNRARTGSIELCTCKQRTPRSELSPPAGHTQTDVPRIPVFNNLMVADDKQKSSHNAFEQLCPAARPLIRCVSKEHKDQRVDLSSC